MTGIYFVTVAVRPIEFAGKGSSWDYASGFVRDYPPRWIERSRQIAGVAGVDRRLVFFRLLDLGELKLEEVKRLESLFAGDASAGRALVVDPAFVHARELFG